MSETSAQAQRFTVTKRSDHRKVELRVELAAGLPVIDSREALATKYPIEPFAANLTYSRYDTGKWYYTAKVYGACRQTLMNGWADFRGYRSSHLEDWPDWLVDLLDQQHPDRPGGWPGDDPEGSYR